MAETIKRDIKKDAGDAEKTVKKAAEKAPEKKPEKAAEKKPAEKKVVEKKSEEKAEKVETATGEKKVVGSKGKKNATGLRVGAVILWLCALACEIVALLAEFEKIEFPVHFDVLYILIFFLVLDLIFLIIGSQLWKKANHKDPVSEKNKLKWWLWNNMGVLVAILVFVPFLILTLTNKNADAKTKKVASIVAAAALAIGVLTSYDYNPMSTEKLNNAETVLADQDIYWTSGGSRYHLDMDCSSLKNSAELQKGTIEEAIEENGKDFLCKFCMKKFADQIEGLENLVYGANAE